VRRMILELEHLIYHEKNRWPMKFPFSHRLPLVILIALNTSPVFLVASESLEVSLTNTNESESNSYLFIRVSINEDIRGFYGCTIDVPTYTYGKSQIISYKYIMISPALIRVTVGQDKSYSGSGNGAVSELSQVTEFPYSAYDFNITDMSDDVVTVFYHSQHFTLKTGDSWSNRSVEILPPKYGENAKITRDFTIENRGRLELVVEGKPVRERCDGIWC